MMLTPELVVGQETCNGVNHASITPYKCRNVPQVISIQLLDLCIAPAARTKKHDRNRSPMNRIEYICLSAGTMMLTALGIDIMLPALSELRHHFGLPANSTAT